MSRIAFEQSVGLLDKLSPTELEQLGARVAAHRVLSGPAPSSPPQVRGAGPAVSDSFVSTLYGAVAERMLDHFGAAQLPFPVFAKTRKGSFFIKGAAAASLVHERWFPKATRVETAAITRIYARCLTEQVKRSPKPLSWPVVAAALHDLPLVMSRCFPGYAQAGAMSIIRAKAMLPTGSRGAGS